MVLSVEDFKLTINCRGWFPSSLLLKLLSLAHLSKPAPYPHTIFRNTYQYLYQISHTKLYPHKHPFPNKHQQSFTKQRWHHFHHFIDCATSPHLWWIWPIDITQTTMKDTQTFWYPRYGRLQRDAASNESWAQIELTNTPSLNVLTWPLQSISAHTTSCQIPYPTSHGM